MHDLLALLRLLLPFSKLSKAAKHKRNIFLLFCSFSLCSTFSVSAHSQSPPDLNRLVFTPVAMQAEEIDGLVNYFEIFQAPEPAPEQKNQAPAFPQTAAIQNPTDLEGSIKRYQELAVTLEIQDGPYNETLGQVHLSTGALHQQLGEHFEAVDVFNRALHLNRLNRGLFNMSQTTIVEELIESHFALGDIESANDKQEYLLYLNEKEHGKSSPNTIPALMSYANWNILAFSTPLELSPKSIISDQTSSSSSGINRSGSGFPSFMYNRLLNAQNTYRTAGLLLYENFGSTDPRLYEVEQRLALTNYLFASNFFARYTDIDGFVVIENTMGYRFGREALQRQISYLEESPQPSSKELLINAKQELADWYLLFQRRSSAFEFYRDAYALFSATNPTEQDKNNYLSPSLPAPIPTFLTEKYTKESYGMPKDLNLEFKGYIDLEFKVNLFGNTGSIKVLGESEDTSPLIKTMLVSKLRSDQFRPRLSDEGKSLDDDRYILRYYYSY